MASWADDEPDPVPVAVPVSYKQASAPAPAHSAGVPAHQAAPAPAPPRARGPPPGTSAGGSGPHGGGGRPAKPVPQHGPWILFVGNLADGVTEEDLRQEFQESKPMDVRLIWQRDSNRIRGCFIEVPSAEALTSGLAHEGALLRGRPLHTDVGDAPRNDQGRSTGSGFSGSYQDAPSSRGGNVPDRRGRKGLTGDGYEESRGGRGGFDRPAPSHVPPRATAPPAPPSAERPKLSLAPRGTSGAVGESGGATAKVNPFGGATANDAAKHYAEQEKKKTEDAERARQARIAEKKKADEDKKAQAGEQHKEGEGEQGAGGEGGKRAVPAPKAGSHPPPGDRKAVPSPREPGHAAPGSGRGAGRGERGERVGGGRRGGGGGGKERTQGSAGEVAAGAPAPPAAPPPKPKVVQPPAQGGPAKVFNAFAALSVDD